MTGIATVTATQTQSSTASDAKKASLDYDAFLKLMIAQLQNQDPLNPMDGSAYVSQLASFSSVEQGLKTNAKLDQLLVMSNIAQASGAVGMHVTTADGSASGVISSVKVDDSGATAILEDGSQVPLTSGVIFGANV
jgi:flagellar basal-body rod modification protein FlgD